MFGESGHGPGGAFELANLGAIFDNEMTAAWNKAWAEVMQAPWPQPGWLKDGVLP